MALEVETLVCEMQKALDREDELRARAERAKRRSDRASLLALAHDDASR